MKIGIATLIGEFNYGNLLQSYALQTVLERMGHKVITLNRRTESVSFKLLFIRLASLINSLFKRYILRNKKILFVSPLAEDYNPHYRLNKNEMHSFVNRCIKRSKPLRSSTAMYQYHKKEQIDAYVVGSDQVWREDYCLSIEENFFSFLRGEKAKRIAYAASFGVEKNAISKEKLSICAELAKKFDAISVREKSGIDICNKELGVEATHVLDPTMLLDKEDYIQLFKATNTPKSEGDLLIYILDKEEQFTDYIEKFAKENTLQPFYFHQHKIDAINYSHKLSSIEKWLRGFYDAKFIITDSFHACVFSIIFQKPFICIGNKNRGMSRFDSLLSMFDLTDRLVDISELNNYKISDIDWGKINKTLSIKRNEAHIFLETSLQE